MSCSLANPLPPEPDVLTLEPWEGLRPRTGLSVSLSEVFTRFACGFEGVDSGRDQFSIGFLKFRFHSDHTCFKTLFALILSRNQRTTACLAGIRAIETRSLELALYDRA